MAEEKIVCRVIEKGPNCDYCFSKPAESYYYCSISNNYCSYDVCKQCSLGMTRQEAIERMAGALHKYEFTYSPVPMPTWCELNDDVKNDYRKMAEAELNALLEGK